MPPLAETPLTLGAPIRTVFMAKLTVEELQEMCKLNLDKRHVREVLETITSAEFRFHPGIVQPQSRMASLYKLRLEMVKEKKVSDLIFLDDYEQVVSSLQKSHSESIALTSLFVQDSGFIIFYEPEIKRILGVIKGKAGSDIPIEAFEA